MNYLFNLTSIFNPTYLLSAVLITLFWLVANKNKAFYTFTSTFRKINWKSTTVVLDIKLTALNFVVLRPVVIATEGFVFLTTYQVLKTQQHLNLFLNPAVEAILVTIFTMLAVDLASYIVHRSLHSKLLWKIHSVHHSAEQLTPLTTYRQHPLEPFLLYSARGFFEGCALALFYYIFPKQTEVVLWFGMGAGFFIYMLTVNMHHWPIPVQYPKLISKILISPHHHHIHHSKAAEHHNSNFGVIFSIWDRLFKTFCDQHVPLNALSFGLSESEKLPTASATWFWRRNWLGNRLYFRFRRRFFNFFSV